MKSTQNNLSTNMSCLFPAYVAAEQKQEIKQSIDQQEIGLETAQAEKVVAPLWLENSSFQTDDAVCLHRRYLDGNEKLTRKVSDSEAEPESKWRKTEKEDETESVLQCESPSRTAHTKKHRKRHSSGSPSDNDHHKKHKKHHSSSRGHHKSEHRNYRSSHRPSRSDGEKSELDEKEIKHREKSDRKNRHKRKHKHKHKHDDEKQERNKDGKDSEAKKISMKTTATLFPGKVFIGDIPDLRPEDAFRVDRRADMNNWEYESLYKMIIAKFRCPKYCLGQNSEFFMSKTEKKSNSKSLADRYFSKENLMLTYDDQHVLDLHEAGRKKNRDKFTDVKADSLEFLSIASAKPEKSEYNPLGVYDERTALYIQGIGPEKDTEPVPETSVDENLKETLSESIKRRTEDFSKKLQERPFDIQLWLDFVKFQDEVFECEVAAERDSGAKTNKGKKQTFLLEKKQAVIDKALLKNPSNVRLQISRLELSADVWDSDTLTKEWEKLVLKYPGDVNLWKEFLLHVQSTFSRFTVSKAVKQYTRCIKTLRDVKARTPKYQHLLPPKDIDKHILGVFVQFCYFLKQSGHAEKSIALFQAMIEFNHFMPEILQQAPREEQIALFEPFWDCCVPRFGDVGAVGWSTWMEKKSMDFPPPLVTAVDEEEDEILDKTVSQDQNWLALEKHREATFWLPWRPDIAKGQGQEDCEDPDRLVLVDDITDFLVLFPGDVRQQLVLDFLAFLDVIDKDVVSHGGALMFSVHSQAQELPKQVHSPKSSQSLDFYSALNSFPSFDEPIMHTFATELFKQVHKLLPAEMKQGILETWMKFEVSRMKLFDGKMKKQQYKEVKKFCKSVLQEESNRSNLGLWELYGRFEWCYGSISDARKVFDMAISMHCKDVVKLPDVEQLQAAQLCFSYCELVLGLHEPKPLLSKKVKLTESQVAHVLYVLTFLIGAGDFVVPSVDHAVTAPQMLKAKKCYLDFWKATCERCRVACQQNEHLAILGKLMTLWSMCYALYQYLGHGIKAAAVVMEETVDTIRPLATSSSSKNLPLRKLGISSHLEQLQVYYIKLLMFHLSTTSAHVGILRSPLMRALQMFPDCPYLLSAFIEMEAGSHIAGRVRRYFDHGVVTSGTVKTWLYAILAELLRKQALMESLASEHQVMGQMSTGVVKQYSPDLGISNRIRSLFNRATLSKDGRRSILLWRMFVHFEVSEGDESRAKAVFYRALQHCPWAKSLYIDGVKYFPGEFQDVTDLMTEKEIRIRCLPEELDILLEEEDGNEEEKADDGDGS